MTFVPNVIPKDDKTAIFLILDGLTKQGCRVTGVVEDSWCPDEVTAVSTVMEAVEAVCGVDEATVYLDLPEGAERASTFIFFVLGNSPEEVACDHGVSLSPYIDPITTPWWS